MAESSPKVAILVTMGDPDQCGECLALLVRSEIPPGTILRVLVHGEQAEHLGPAIHRAVNSQNGVDVQVAVMKDVNRLDAVNLGVHHVLESHPDVTHVILVDEDARMSTGWVQGLLDGLTPSVVHGLGDRTILGLGRIGIVGPCSDQTRSPSQRMELTEQETGMGLDGYAAARLSHFPGAVSVAEFVDGSVVLMTRTCVEDVVQDGVLVNPGCGTWTWADLCLKARTKGHRTVVSESVFIGRSTHIGKEGETPGNLVDRLTFYASHSPPEEHRVIGCVLVEFRTWEDIQTLRVCVARLGPLVDGIALVVGSHPLEVQSDPEFIQVSKRLSPMDRKLLTKCNGAQVPEVQDALTEWMNTVLDKSPHRRVGRMSVRAEVPVGAPDARAKRNVGLRMAKDLGGDGCLILHHDELVEDSVTRQTIQRTLGHPNPLARCFDLGFVYHHESLTLVREDSPLGHGGDYRGGGHGPRLYRWPRGAGPGVVDIGNRPGFLPDHGVEAHRVSGTRLRKLGSLRQTGRERMGVTDTGEGIRVSEWTGQTRAGLHVLVWSGENPEDIARWLDVLHTLVDRVVLVWTDEWDEDDRVWTQDRDHLTRDEWFTTGPSREFAALGFLHGVHWEHHPLNDHIAEARNKGIRTLRELDESLTWAIFIDPDEWMTDPLHDCVALRNMMTSTRWGYLFQVANFRAGEPVPTISDSVRMSRLDPDGVMVMDGRVHEGFGKAIHTLQSRDIHPRLVYAPFILHHRGLAKDTEAMGTKLDKYENLLRLQLTDEPHDPGAWVSLGWNYLNDGHEELAVECYHRAVQCAGTSYLPFRELAYHHLRTARDLMDKCDQRLSNGHQFHGLCQSMREWLHKFAPPPPVIHRVGDREPRPLPSWTPPETD